MPKITIDKEKCKGCGLCVLACPKKLIVMSDEFNKKGITRQVFLVRKIVPDVVSVFRYVLMLLLRYSNNGKKSINER